MQFRIKNIVEALRSSDHPNVEGIHPEGVFMAILKHERAVAERNNHVFTVLAFFSKENDIGATPAQVVGRILAERLRATDQIGWLDSRTIGVILPDAGGKEASLVADQICHKMTEHQITLDYKTFLYPYEDFKGAGNSPRATLATGGENSPATSGGCVTLSGKEGSVQCSVSAGAETGRPRRLSPLTDLCVEPFPAWKRLLDVGICVCGLLVFGPVMLLIALGIKVISPGPVIFKQERIGFKGKPFMLYKFRSMRPNADTGVHKDHLARLMTSNAKLIKLDNSDTRLIPFGKYFRASGLDELPQLFNVFRGDMSFIGPRPCVQYEYEQLDLWQKHRFDTYPGLTGLWQVNGKNRTTFMEMMRLDISYGQRRTVMKDLRILMKTLPAVIGQIRDCATVKR